LLLAPTGNNDEALKNALDVSFGLRATQLDLTAVLDGSDAVAAEQQALCALAIAAAMRPLAS
jgi:hypothetical protein